MTDDLPADDLPMSGADRSILDTSNQKNGMWGLLLRGLEDQILLESYQHAVKLMLEKDFIELLREELLRRGMTESIPLAELEPLQPMHGS